MPPFPYKLLPLPSSDISDIEAPIGYLLSESPATNNCTSSRTPDDPSRHPTLSFLPSPPFHDIIFHEFVRSIFDLYPEIDDTVIIPFLFV